MVSLSLNAWLCCSQRPSAMKWDGKMPTRWHAARGAAVGPAMQHEAPARVTWLWFSWSLSRLVFFTASLSPSSSMTCHSPIFSHVFWFYRLSLIKHLFDLFRLHLKPLFTPFLSWHPSAFVWRWCWKQNRKQIVSIQSRDHLLSFFLASKVTCDRACILSICIVLFQRPSGV